MLPNIRIPRRLIVITSYSIHYTKLYDYRRVEFWISMLALHKIGAVAIPSPKLLTTKDIVERVGFAGIRAIIAEYSVRSRVQRASEKSGGIDLLIQVGGTVITSYSIHYTKLYDVIYERQTGGI